MRLGHLTGGQTDGPAGSMHEHSITGFGLSSVYQEVKRKTIIDEMFLEKEKQWRNVWNAK